MLPHLFLPFFWFIFIFGGLAVNVTYAMLTGAHPSVDLRFEKHGYILRILLLLFSLIAICISMMLEMITKGLVWTEFFSYGGSGSMLILGLSLFAMGSSITYRRYLDKREEED
ncbi:hypothetical protein [Streptococcus sp. S784/96/1]|uniref:hypothetical protein n=1 Tax=Streptococcus sp. S784/96/1 TaxID=2653499 RepID=UPI0013873DE8|nr:hypothetical protein [Streptococcus sp. S784/96/1]